MTSIGKYEIQGELGHGGFGKVYRAFDPALRHVVAIKVLTAEGGPEILNRFRNEAMVAVNLHHKNIVTVHDFGEADGVPYIVMEFLEGRDLQHVLNSGERLTLLEKVQIMTQVAEGLYYAHSHDVAHRDVKPANIMLQAGNLVKIMDFGVARVMRDDVTRHTRTGFLLGTIPYMCPEQFQDPPISDALSDIWAYGVIYYELLAGRHPFKTASSSVMMYRIANEEPPPLLKQAPECPAALADIVHRLLIKDRAQRYQSLEDVIFDTGPILFELQKEQVASLNTEAGTLLAAGQLDEAQAVVRRALDLNRTDLDALHLREAIQQQMRRRNLRPRIESQLRKGEEAFNRRQFAAAVEALEAARQIDPNDSSIRLRLEQVRAALDQSRHADDLLSQAKAQLQAQDLSGAYRSAAEAARADPQHPEADRLADEVKEAIAEREKQRRVREVMDKARGLLMIEAFADAIALLQDLLASHPGSAEIAQMLRSAEEQKIAREKSDRLREGSEAAREQIRQRRFEEAIRRLEALCAEFGAATELETLLAFARDQLQVERRDEALQKISGEANAFLAEGKFDAALQILEQGLQTWRGEPALVTLLQSVENAKRNFEHRLDVDGAVRHCRELRAGGHLREAREAIEGALTRLGSDTALLNLRKELEKALAERQRAEAIQQTVQEAGSLISRGQPERAVSLLRTTSAQFSGEKQIEALLEIATHACEEAEERRFVQEQLAAAEQAQRTGDSPQALRILEAALGRYPHAAELTQARGRLQQSIRTAERISLLTRQIDEKVRSGQLDEASTQVENAEREFPSERSWSTLRKRILQARKQAEAAAAVAAVKECLAAGDLARARQLWESASRAAAGDPDLRRLEREIQVESDYRAGMAAAAGHLDRQEWDLAATVLRQAEALRPADPAVRALADKLASAKACHESRRLATALKFDNALDLLDRRLQSYPGNAELEHARQEILAARLQHERELDAQRVAREREEDRRLVQGLVSARQFDLAVAKTRDLMARFPGDAELEADLRAIESARRQFLAAQVEAAYQSNLAEALAHRNRQEWDQAEESARKAGEAKPDDPAVRDLLGGLAADRRSAEWRRDSRQQAERLLQTGDYDAALELLSRLLDRYPNDAELLRDQQAAMAARQAIEEPARKWSAAKVAAIAGGLLAAVVLIWVLTREHNPASLQISPGALDFAWTVGDPVPASQNLRIEGGASGKITATADQPWLQVADGKSPGTLAVSVQPSTLKSGDYHASLQVSAGGKAPPTQVVVSLNVTGPRAVSGVTPPPTPAPPAGLKLTADSLSFDYEKGSTLPPARPIELTSAGSAVRFRVATQSAGNWLVASPQSGTTPATLRVSVRNMNPGTYAGKIVVTAGDAARTIPVALVVGSGVRPTPPPAPTSAPTPAPTPAPTLVPTPPPPSNTCAAPLPWGGKLRSSFSWRGKLAPGARLVIAANGAANGVLEGGGSASPDYGPCLQVTVTAPAGFDIQSPSAANQYRLVVVNKTGAPVEYIPFNWSLR